MMKRQKRKILNTFILAPFIILIIFFLKSFALKYLYYNYAVYRGNVQRDLQNIYRLQKNYFNRNNKYAQDIEELRFKPLHAQRSKFTINKTEFALNEQGIARVNINIPNNGFIAVAESRIDSDPIVDILLINQKGELINIISDATDKSEYINLNDFYKAEDFVNKIDRANIDAATIIFSILIILFLTLKPIIKLRKE